MVHLFFVGVVMVNVLLFLLVSYGFCKFSYTYLLVALRWPVYIRGNRSTGTDMVYGFLVLLMPARLLRSLSPLKKSPVDWPQRDGSLRTGPLRTGSGAAVHALGYEPLLHALGTTLRPTLAARLGRQHGGFKRERAGGDRLSTGNWHQGQWGRGHWRQGDGELIHALDELVEPRCQLPETDRPDVQRLPPVLAE